MAQFKANPNYPAKAMYRISGFQFYNTSEFTLAELINDADNLAANFKAYLQSFCPVMAKKRIQFQGCFFTRRRKKKSNRTMYIRCMVVR